MKAKEEKLTVYEHLINIGNTISLPITLLIFAHFCWTLQTKRRGKNRGKPVTPMTIDLLAGSRAPAASQEFLRRYGVQSFAWGAYYEIRNGHKVRPFSISISSANAEWADQLLAYKGWDIQSAPQSARNLKKLPTPWAAPAKNRTIDEHARYWMGRLLGAID